MVSLSVTGKIWQEAAAQILQQMPPADKKQYRQRITEIKETLAQSPHGQLILNWAEQNQTQILMDPQADGHGSYTVGSNTVLLNPNRSNQDLATVLCHELRHAWQDAQNLIPSQSMEDPKKYAAQVRFIEADAFAYSFVAAYELFGHDALCSQNSFTTQHYAKTIKLATDHDPYALKNGTAMFLAFNSFFNNAFLRSQYDTSSLHKYAAHMGAKETERTLSESGISTHSAFNSISFSSPKCAGLNLIDFKETQKLGALFGAGNYLQHGWAGMIKDPTYCGNFSADFETTCAAIQKHKKPQGLQSCR